MHQNRDLAKGVRSVALFHNNEAKLGDLPFVLCSTAVDLLVLQLTKHSNKQYGEARQDSECMLCAFVHDYVNAWRASQ
jgi:hypothetical protein